MKLRNPFHLEPSTVSHTERLVSTLGGFLVIFAVFQVSSRFLGPAGILLIVPSMGASAVLLFAVPHGALSQPWNVFGGHIISALIGVTCAMLVPDIIIAASLAVGLAVGAMYYLRCIHPPGGATALAAVIGGEATRTLGFQFVFTPILLNVLVMLAVALLFNYPFAWRRYPAWLADRLDTDRQPAAHEHKPAIAHANLVSALSQIDSFIDVSEHDLLRIYELATGQAEQQSLRPEQIVLGRYYSNGQFGADWSIRQIVDESSHTDPERDMVVYKVMAGRGMRTSGVLSRADFARWARYEVSRDDENWKRLTGAGGPPD
ncbi:MAG: HPP family protein [Gammaproteobacteria bacterium]|jgi:CBS-domain-containing membrane protein